MSMSAVPPIPAKKQLLDEVGGDDETLDNLKSNLIRHGGNEKSEIDLNRVLLKIIQKYPSYNMPQDVQDNFRTGAEGILSYTKSEKQRNTVNKYLKIKKSQSITEQDMETIYNYFKNFKNDDLNSNSRDLKLRDWNPEKVNPGFVQGNDSAANICDKLWNVYFEDSGGCCLKCRAFATKIKQVRHEYGTRSKKSIENPDYFKDLESENAEVKNLEEQSSKAGCNEEKSICKQLFYIVCFTVTQIFYKEFFFDRLEQQILNISDILDEKSLEDVTSLVQKTRNSILNEFNTFIVEKKKVGQNGRTVELSCLLDGSDKVHSWPEQYLIMLSTIKSDQISLCLEWSNVLMKALQKQK
jgi:hypothetical protein